MARRPIRATIALALISMAVPACTPAAARDDRVDTLTIGAYSVVREAFRESLLPAFAQAWKARTGRTVRFQESYNASGAQARAIAAGFDADVAVLSLEGDVNLLVEKGLVRKTWKDDPRGGMVTRGMVVIGVRPGNPKGIADWDDLARPGVSVLYPDPKSSGGARWNINAIYGAGLLRSGGDRQAARDLLARVQANVVNMDASGRQSMASFDRGIGDAVVTYENELLLRKRLHPSLDVPYVVPHATLMIEGPGAVVDASVDRHGNRAVAEAFVEFLRSAQGQAIFVAYGFRPFDPALDDPRRPPLAPKLFAMADLGGWSQVKQAVYDTGGVWDSLFTGRRLAKGRPR